MQSRSRKLTARFARRRNRRVLLERLENRCLLAGDPINLEPTFEATDPPAVLEDAGPQTVNSFATFDPGDPSESNQNVLAYHVTSVSRPELFSSEPSIDLFGNLTYTPAADEFGTSTFVVTVQDDGGTVDGGIDTSAPQTFTITVNPVNDAPTFALAGDVSVNEDTGSQSVENFAIDFDPGANEAGTSEDVQTLHDEGVDGTSAPLSTDNLNPTDLGLLAHGSNVVRGYVELAKSIGDVDVFRFEVPTGFQLSGLRVLEYEYPVPPSNPGERNAFLAINDDTTFPYNAFELDFNENPDLDETQFLGGTVFGLDDVPDGENILPRAGRITGRRFTGPLPAGIYTIYIQQTGPASRYALDFQVTESSLQSVAEYVVTNVSNPSLFVAQPQIDTNGKLTFTPADNAFGSTTFDVTVRDDGGIDDGGVDTSTAVIGTIIINPVNDAPEFELSDEVVVNEDAGPQSVAQFATAFFPGLGEDGESEQSQVIHDEGADGTVDPLSADNQNPTNLGALAHGSNVVRGTVEAAKNVGNVDVFTFTVDSGFVLSSLEVLEYSYAVPPSNPNERNAFLAINDGTTFPYNAFELDINENPFLDENAFLGGTVFGLDDLPTADGGNILPRAGVITGRGFSGPLPAGTYTIYIQQTGPANSYALDFGVTSVTAQTLLGYSITNVSDPSLFSEMPIIDAEGTLTFTSANDRFGSATFEVTAQDDGGTANGGTDTSITKIATISVTPVNDSPSFSIGGEVVVDEDSGTQTVPDYITNFDPGVGEDGTSSDIQVLHDEGTLGAESPLSTDNSNPTPLGSLALGSNVVHGHVESAKNIGDVDVFSFTVEPGHQINGLFVLDYAYDSPPSNPNERNAFLAINDGISFPYNAFELDINENPFLNENAFLGGTVFGLDDLPAAGGGNILPRAGVITGRGFSGPLPAGTYTIYIQQTGPGNTYSLDFQVTKVESQTLVGYTISNVSDSSLFDSPPVISNDGSLSFRPAPDRFGTVTFDVTAQDSGGTEDGGSNISSPRTGTITLRPVNDAPSFVAFSPPAVPQNSGPQSVPNIASGFDPGSAFESSQGIDSYLVAGVENPSLFAVLPSVDESGTLTYTPATDVFGTSTFELVVKDDGGTDNSGEDLSQPITLKIRVVGPADFGDAPVGTSVQLADDGPHHALSSLFLGETITIESDGQPSENADADDDDGVTMISTILTDLSSTNIASLGVDASEAGFLTAWIDFDQDQVFEDEERIHTGLISAGPTTLSFQVPPLTEGTVIGNMAARFRLSSESILIPTGGAPDGEVEDYLLTAENATATTAVNVNLIDTVAEIQMTVAETQTASGNILVRDQNQLLFSAPSQNFGSLHVVATPTNDVVTLNYNQGSLTRSGGIVIDGSDGENRLQATGGAGDFELNGAGNIEVHHFSTLDLAQSAVNLVSIEAGGIRQFAPITLTLNVITGDENTLEFQDPSDWRMGTTGSNEGTFFRQVINIKGGGEKLVLQDPHPWHNVVEPSDVNNDGNVLASDALAVINELRRRSYSNATTQETKNPLSVETWPGVYYDQNQDDRVSGLDALRIINAFSKLNPEGEQIPTAAIAIIDRELAETNLPFGSSLDDHALDFEIESLNTESPKSSEFESSWRASAAKQHATVFASWGDTSSTREHNTDESTIEQLLSDLPFLT